MDAKVLKKVYEKVETYRDEMIAIQTQLTAIPALARRKNSCCRQRTGSLRPAQKLPAKSSASSAALAPRAQTTN